MHFADAWSESVYAAEFRLVSSTGVPRRMD